MVRTPPPSHRGARKVGTVRGAHRSATLAVVSVATVALTAPLVAAAVTHSSGREGPAATQAEKRSLVRVRLDTPTWVADQTPFQTTVTLGWWGRALPPGVVVLRADGQRIGKTFVTGGLQQDQVQVAALSMPAGQHLVSANFRAYGRLVGRSLPVTVTSGGPIPTSSPTDSASSSPTSWPTWSPTGTPSSSPTGTPTTSPTGTPSSSPTGSPSGTPTASPSGSPTGTPTSSPTQTPTAPPTASPTGVPSSFPNASTTGYRNAPGYTGTLKSGAGVTIQSGQTYVGYDFSGDTSVGTRSNPVRDVTFIGCRFRGSGDLLVALYGSDITFKYSSFEPSTGTTPVSYSQGYQYGISADGAYYTHVEGLTLDHVDMWGFGNAVNLSRSTKAAPVVIRDSWIHDARADGGKDHTDGIGELQGSAMSFVTIDHNTIESKGNTNGIAFQYGPYSDFTITNNLIGGWGYAVAIGAQGPGPISRITFTGNTYSTRIPSVFGPLYPANFWSGNGNLWRSNRWDDGRYWTPNGPRTTDYSG